MTQQVGDFTIKFSECKTCGKPQNIRKEYRRPGTLQNQNPRPQYFYTCEDQHRKRPTDA